MTHPDPGLLDEATETTTHTEPTFQPDDRVDVLVRGLRVRRVYEWPNGGLWVELEDDDSMDVHTVPIADVRRASDRPL